MRVLGIDPGTQRIGYGIVEQRRNALALIASGLLPITTRGGEALPEVKKEVDALVRKFKPDIAGIEKLFFAKNQKTAFSVAETRGVILLSLLQYGIRVIECAPNEVKLAVTGYGLADKRAVLKMVRLSLDKPDLKVIDDVSDALAIAIFTSRAPFAGGRAIHSSHG